MYLLGTCAWAWPRTGGPRLCFPCLWCPDGNRQVMFHLSPEGRTFKDHNPWPNTEYLIRAGSFNWLHVCVTVSQVRNRNGSALVMIRRCSCDVEMDADILYDKVYGPREHPMFYCSCFSAVSFFSLRFQFNSDSICSPTFLSRQVWTGATVTAGPSVVRHVFHTQWTNMKSVWFTWQASVWITVWSLMLDVCVHAVQEVSYLLYNVPIIRKCPSGE